MSRWPRSADVPGARIKPMQVKGPWQSSWPDFYVDHARNGVEWFRPGVPSPDALTAIATLPGLLELAVVGWEGGDVIAPASGTIEILDVEVHGSAPVTVDLSATPTLKQVVLRNATLSGLSGLENLTRLQRLHCWDASADHDVEPLDLSGLGRATGLTVVSLGEQPVASLAPLAGLASMTFIGVGEVADGDRSLITVAEERRLAHERRRAARNNP